MKSKMKMFGAKLARSPFSLCLAAFGIFFIITGLILYIFLMHDLINRVIDKKLAIAEGSETYEKWKAIPMPIYYKYYFFNVSNAAEIEKTGAKPIVKEIGPFTYRSFWNKNAIKFNSNGTVSFRERKVLYFVPELSVASETDKILTTINGPLTVTLALLQKAPLVVRNIVSLTLSTVSEGFFVKRSARELLYEGYPEMLTSLGPLLNPNLPNTKGRFGWQYGRNNTDDGLFTVFTGVDNIKQINRIDRYNGKESMSYWKNDSDCNRIHQTTDAQIIAPSNEEPKSFELFHPEICRKIKLVADRNFNSSKFTFARHRDDDPDPSLFRDNEAHPEGSPNIKFPFDRYTPHPDTFSSVDEYPANACYESKITPSRPEIGDLLLNFRQNNQNTPRPFPVRPFSSTRGGRIYFKSGVFDLSTCKYGAPVLLSYPHFLHAHPSYRENIGGLRPDASKHQFSVMVEPRTGTSIASYARMQINIFISKPPWVTRFRYIPEIVFPVFWQELHAEVPSDVIEHINWALTMPFAIADIVSIGFILLGLALIVNSAFLLLKDGIGASGSSSLNTLDGKKDNKSTFRSESVDMKALPREAKEGFINAAMTTDEEVHGPATIAPDSQTVKGSVINVKGNS